MVCLRRGGAKDPRRLPFTGSFLAPQPVTGYKRSMSESATTPAGLKAVLPFIFALLGGCLGLAWSTAAKAQASPWAQGDKSQARLLAAGGLAGSKNLTSAQALYPAPRRYPEAGGEAFGYMDEVLFPLRVTPADPTKPVSLALKLDYATCDKICIPARAELSLDLAPDARRSEEAALLQAWVERTPRPPGDPAAPRPSLTPGDKPGAWRVRFAGPAPADLFAEGPQDWFFDTSRTAEGFDLTLAQKPADAPAGPVVVILTMVVGAHAFEARTPLDVEQGKP